MDILLVDDNQDCLELVKNVLENEGMTVHCVESGENALCELVSVRKLHFSELRGAGHGPVQANPVNLCQCTTTSVALSQF